MRLIGPAAFAKLAADHNCPPDQWNYGLCFENRRGIAVDLIRAATCYTLSVDQNYAAFHCLLSDVLGFGRAGASGAKPFSNARF
jgi:TPR repeat protein